MLTNSHFQTQPAIRELIPPDVLEEVRQAIDNVGNYRGCHILQPGDEMK